MRIQHNVTAMNSYRNFNTNNSNLSKNLEKLSSGYKINRAGDDAAGLAISEKMRAQITGLEGATKNAKDGISLIQTAEGALTEVHSMLNRMTTLAEQSANGTYDNDVDRVQLQKEVDALKTEINRIADSTNFNGLKLLDGSLGGWKNTTAITEAMSYDNFTVSGGQLKNGDAITVTQSSSGMDVKSVTVGDVTVAKADLASKGLSWEADANNPAGKTGAYKFTLKVTDRTKATADIADAVGEGLSVTVNVKEKVSSNTDLAFTTDGTGGGLTLQIGDTSDDFNKMNVLVGDMHTKALGIADIDISTQEGAANAMDFIKNAINTVSDTRGGLGALQNRLDHTINNLGVMRENIQNAESNIRDTDVAEEMMAYTKNNILNQAAQAMLAQANQMPQGVLQLLQ